MYKRAWVLAGQAHTASVMVAAAAGVAVADMACSQKISSCSGL